METVSLKVSGRTKEPEQLTSDHDSGIDEVYTWGLVDKFLSAEDDSYSTSFEGKGIADTWVDPLASPDKSVTKCQTELTESGKLNLVFLAAAPGNGGTWLRLLLEQATGFQTASLLPDGNLRSVLPGEKTDPAKNQTILTKTCYLDDIAVKKAGGYVSGCIYLFRDPKMSIVSDFLRRCNTYEFLKKFEDTKHWHLGGREYGWEGHNANHSLAFNLSSLIDHGMFKRQIWKETKSLHFKMLEDLYVGSLSDARKVCKNSILVSYESMSSSSESLRQNIGRVIDFLNYSIPKAEIKFRESCFEEDQFREFMYREIDETLLTRVESYFTDEEKQLYNEQLSSLSLMAEAMFGVGLPDEYKFEVPENFTTSTLQ